MKRYGDILRELRKRKGYKQQEVEKKLNALGIEGSNTNISRWERSLNSPSIEQFIGLCAIYGVRDIYNVFEKGMIEEELNAEGNRKLEDYKQLLIASGLYKVELPGDNVLPLKPRRTVPNYDIGVSAGTGVFLDSDHYEMIEVPDYVPIEATFSLRVSGSSMEPTFHDGDTIWVKQQPTLENGDIGVFVLDGDAYVKEYCEKAGEVSLISHNCEYPPIRITENNYMRICGKVVYPK